MNKHPLWRIIPYFSKYRWILVLDLIAAGLSSVCELAFPMIIRFITEITTKNQLTLKIVLYISLIYILLKLVNVAGRYYMTSIGHIMGAKIETDMRFALFGHLQKLSYSYYNESKTGQLIARFTSDLFDITEFTHHFPEEAFLAIIKIIISFLVLSTINLPLTLIIFSTLPLLYILTLNFNRKMHKASLASRVQIGELNGQLEDSLLGIRVVKSFANEDIELNNFQQANEKFLTIKTQVYHAMAGLHASTFFLDGLMQVMVISVGSLFIIHGQISGADLIAYILYSFTLFFTIMRMIEFSESFQKGITGIERFFEIMDTPIEMPDQPNALAIAQPRGEIVLDNVSFHYQDQEKDILNQINLTVKPGQNIALVGPSGSGKTTFCNLIPRFYDVTSGRILLDGLDIRDITLHSLRKNIGIVQQEVYLFSGTIYENILYGNPQASQEEVIEAAKLADAHDFITAFPKQYETHIGERGVKLSGGQKQRISIARVFLKNPPVLILDEATSALDNQSEQHIQKSLEQLAKNRTTFTIAHRLSTIHHADLILVLTENGIEEQGTHAELMAKKNLYYQLYTLSQVAEIS